MLHPLQFRARLTTRYCGHHLLQLCRTDSTNRVLAEWSHTGLGGRQLPIGTTLIATHQTHGRGQRGHHWTSPPGGLYLSTSIPPPANTNRALELTLAIAWGIARQLRQSFHLPVQLKWPNDLVADHRKLGGILLQTRSAGNQITTAIAGVGINVNNPTPPIGTTIATLLGRPVEVEAVACATIQGIETGCDCWLSHGLAGIRPGYEALMIHRHRTIALPSGPGTICGITPTGQLLVSTVSGEQGFAPGSLSLGYDPSLSPSPSLTVES